MGTPGSRARRTPRCSDSDHVIVGGDREPGRGRVVAGDLDVSGVDASEKVPGVEKGAYGDRPGGGNGTGCRVQSQESTAAAGRQLVDDATGLLSPETITVVAPVEKSARRSLPEAFSQTRALDSPGSRASPRGFRAPRRRG